MTYEEYQQQKAHLESALASLNQQYMAEHGLVIGTRVRYQGQLGYVDGVTMDWQGRVWHSIKGENKALTYGALLNELKVVQ